DFHVTGVQTCALPIFPLIPETRGGTDRSMLRKTALILLALFLPGFALADDLKVELRDRAMSGQGKPALILVANKPVLQAAVDLRSEERRVGKEGRTRV